MKLGIQLFSIRDALEKDFAGTLRAVKEMGVDGAEFAWNYGGMEPVPLAAFLKKTGLLCCGLHTSVQELHDAASKSYQYRVSAVNGFGPSLATLSGSIAATTPPTAPSDLKGTAIRVGNRATVTLTWADNSGTNETGFTVERATNGRLR